MKRQPMTHRWLWPVSCPYAAAPVALSQLALDAIKLKDYVESSKHWWSFLAFGKKGAAAPVVARYGLPLSPETATRALAFMEGVRARGLLSDFEKRNVGKGGDLPDDVLARSLADLGALLTALELVGTDPALAPQAARGFPVAGGFLQLHRFVVELLDEFPRAFEKQLAKFRHPIVGGTIHIFTSTR